jgi:hypothetical protein
MKPKTSKKPESVVREIKSKTCREFNSEERKGSNLISPGKFGFPTADRNRCLPCGMRSLFLWGGTTFGATNIFRAIEEDRLILEDLWHKKRQKYK